MPSIKLCVRWTPRTLDVFKDQGVNLTWDEKKEYEFTSGQEATLTFDHVADHLQALVESYHLEKTGGAETIQVQVRAVLSSKGDGVILPFPADVEKHVKSGDTIVADAMAISESYARRVRGFLEQKIKLIRSQLRFDLSDRVVCYCGTRWLSGVVVGTAVEDPQDEDDIMPYLVKTDPIPGAPSRTISVPSDHDGVCTQEVCFDPESELHLVKAATPVMPQSKTPKTRFAVGDKVVCRIKSKSPDALENWVTGTVKETWAKLPGELEWELGPLSGKFSEVVPYKVDLDSGSWVFCQRDDHTLIRRAGLEPQTKVRGISKRMEVRTAADGSKERIDHATERRKRMMEKEPSSDDSS